MRAFTASDNVSHRSRSTAARCLCDAPEGLKNDMERTHLYSRTQGELPSVAQESDCSTCLNPGVRHSLGVPWGPGVRSPRGGRRRRFRRVGHTPASQAQWTSPAQA